MATASFASTGIDSEKSRSAMRGANPENFNVMLNGQAVREPRRFIYIHSVAHKAFGPIKRKCFGGLLLKGCEAGERFVTCAVVPDPIPQGAPDETNGGTRIYEADGWRACIDLLNPANLSTDPYLGDKNPDFARNTSGNNLIAEGVWPSLNEKPTEQEIKRAEKCRDEHYRSISREALRLYAKSTREGNEFVERYPDVHIAMDALGLEAPWHQRNEVKATCPNCGDKIQPGLGFHQSSAGVLCVIDPAKAYKAGAITKEKYEELATMPDESEPPLVQAKRR